MNECQVEGEQVNNTKTLCKRRKQKRRKTGAKSRIYIQIYGLFEILVVLHVRLCISVYVCFYYCI